MAVEDEYLSILQNMEFAIVQVYRQQPDLIDTEVLNAIDVLVRRYGAEAQGRSVSNRSLRGISLTVAEAEQAMCEWLLGRSPKPEGVPKELPVPEPETVEVITACLKRIQSSIKFWTKKSGRQGYLDFIGQFLPQ